MCIISAAFTIRCDRFWHSSAKQSQQNQVCLSRLRHPLAFLRSQKLEIITSKISMQFSQTTPLSIWWIFFGYKQKISLHCSRRSLSVWLLDFLSEPSRSKNNLLQSERFDGCSGFLVRAIGNDLVCKTRFVIRKELRGRKG